MVLLRHPAGDGVVNHGRVSHAALGQHPAEEVGVVDAVVVDGMILARLGKLQSLQAGWN